MAGLHGLFLVQCLNLSLGRWLRVVGAGQQLRNLCGKCGDVWECACVMGMLARPTAASHFHLPSHAMVIHLSTLDSHPDL